MDCQEVQSLLSAYHDDELSSGLRPPMAEHLGSCPRCRDELAVFGRMSGMSKELFDPEPPQGIWAGIEATLDADRADGPTVRQPTQPRRVARKWRLGLLATAATVLIATGVVWFAPSPLRPSHHGELAASFEQYLAHFADSPEMAQDMLLAKYEGRRVDLAEATTEVGYRPAVGSGLPSGYSLESMYVLDMPCCKCLQTICRRDDGRVFAIFEHDEEQPGWYGDRDRIDTQCNGRACVVAEAPGGLLASWKAGKRQLTVVGASDLDDVTDLIAHLQTGTPEA